MTYKLDLYIGSDNGTRRIRRDYLDRIVKWADENFPNGYTLLKGRGYYEGNQEDSLVLSVLTDYDVDVRKQVAELKQRLDQNSIVVTKHAVECEYV